MSFTGTLPGLTADDSDQFEAAIKKFVDSRELPLYKMMAYHLGWVDQNGEPEPAVVQDRSHGHLVLSVAKAVGLDNASAMPYAVSVEMLYNFLLVHEDVQNANTERNMRPTIWWAWGPAQAINAGDGIHAMARMSIFEQRNASGPAADPRYISMALESLDNATLDVCEGEYLDISYQERAAVSVAEIVSVARKHGALYGVSAKLGGIAAAANNEVLDALYKFGSALGTAQNLNIDLQAQWPKEGTERSEVQRGRLQSKKKSIATAHAIENGTPTTRRRLGEIFMKRVLDPADLDEVTIILGETESRAFAEGKIDELLDEALDALEGTSFSDEQQQSLADSAKLIVGTK
ncbi:MAG: polyprenyl synthetase family protein [Dehalococcoidia bacterium]|nr:polyprenyl synthetase family protein [Dehalococcoidia bacterium]